MSDWAILNEDNVVTSVINQRNPPTGVYMAIELRGSLVTTVGEVWNGYSFTVDSPNTSVVGEMVLPSGLMILKATKGITFPDRSVQTTAGAAITHTHAVADITGLNLNSLSDAVITTPTYRDTPTYNGTEWINQKNFYIVTAYADKTLTNVSTNQSVFDVADDYITLPAGSSWLIAGTYIISSGIVTHTTSISFGNLGNGTCQFTTTSCGTSAYAVVQRNQDFAVFNTYVGGAVNATAVTPILIINFTGILRMVNSATVNPTLRFSALPGGTNLTKAGSYMRFTRLFNSATQPADAEFI